MKGAQTLRMLAPFLSWAPRVDRGALRLDLGSGIVIAILVLPQGLAYASVAGLPPIHGIYVCIVPAFIAALWGSSWHTVSGPNAGMAVIVGATIAPLAAAGSGHYLGLVLMLGLMVGIVQFAIGVFRLGGVLDFISSTVISAVVMAIAVVVVASGVRSLTEIPAVGGQSILMQLVGLARNLLAANPYSVAVGGCAVIAGFTARRFLPKYALLVAVGVGWAVAWLLEMVLGAGQFSVALIGSFDLEAFAFVIPWRVVEGDIPFMAMAPGVVALAILGMAQTVVMSRSTAKKSQQLIDTNQEVVGQGLSNIAAAFGSSFASSGSFNLTAVNYQAGARTPIAAASGALLLLALLLLAADAVALIPAAAIGGTLVIVGYGLMDFKAVRSCMRTPAEMVAWLATFSFAVGIGFNEAIAAGILVSLVNYLWHASKPNIRIEEHYARDGRRVTSVTLDGNMFFGSAQYFERALAEVRPGKEAGIFLLRTDHMTYLDVPGAQALEEQASRRAVAGDSVYVYLTRPRIEAALRQAGCATLLSGDAIIRRDHDHPMKEVLYPHRMAPIHAGATSNRDKDVSVLANEARQNKVLTPIPDKTLAELLRASGVRQAAAGEALLGRSESAHTHILLIDGKVESHRSWTTADGVHKSSTRIVGPDLDRPDLLLLLASPHGVELHAVTEATFIAIEADAVDGFAGRRLAAVDKGASAEVAEGLSRTGISLQLPGEILHKVIERMEPIEVESGHPVVVQDEPGEDYYLVEEGHAEVWREDPLSGNLERIAQIGPGDSFGEEALLQGGYRNATVRMTTAGKVLRLSKPDFETLLKEPLAREIAADEAKALLDTGAARLIDCRYDMEFQENRIPGAVNLPLDELRTKSHGLELGGKYIVYCRNGQRSGVAAFLLKERGIDAVSLTGGIAGWLSEIDLSPIDS